MKKIVQVEVAKEIDDVLVLVKELVADIKAKKDAATLMAENIQHLMTAIEGIDKIPQELKEELSEVIMSGMVRTGEIIKVLVTPSPVVVA